MELSRRRSLIITLTVLGVSIFAWVLLLVNPNDVITLKHCGIPASGSSTSSLQLLPKINSFSSQLLGWGLMVIAMMLPKLILPIELIFKQSFKRYRLLHSMLFVLGYLTSWMVAGIFIVAAIIKLNLFMPLSYIPAIAVFILAVIWEFSPIKQRFLNLGHEHRVLAAFGWAASRDSLSFGVTHGMWCIGSGWALMLFPMLLPQGHNLAMILVTIIMISEHLEHPRLPEWRFNFRLKLLRIVVAQTKIKLKPLLN